MQYQQMKQQAGLVSTPLSLQARTLVRQYGQLRYKKRGQFWQIIIWQV